MIRYTAHFGDGYGATRPSGLDVVRSEDRRALPVPQHQSIIIMLAPAPPPPPRIMAINCIRFCVTRSLALLERQESSHHSAILISTYHSGPMLVGQIYCTYLTGTWYVFRRRGPDSLRIFSEVHPNADVLRRWSGLSTIWSGRWARPKTNIYDHTWYSILSYNCELMPA